MRMIMTMVGVAAVSMLLTGCASPMGSTSGSLGGNYISPDEAAPMRVGLNNTDLNIVAQEVTDALKRKGLPKGFVVGLGPVDSSGSVQPVPFAELAEAIRASLEDDGSLKFSEIVESDRGKVAEILKVKDLNWEIANPSDTEERYKVGRIANINGLLIGRVSSEEAVTPDGKAQQIVYRFFWRLVDTDSGLSLMSYRHQLAKSLPRH